MSKPLWKDRTWLELHYVQLGMSTDKMARLAGCTGPTIIRWMRSYHIPLRTAHALSPQKRARRMEERRN